MTNPLTLENTLKPGYGRKVMEAVNDKSIDPRKHFEAGPAGREKSQ